MYGHLELRAIARLLDAASGRPDIRSMLSSDSVLWLREKGLVNDEGNLTAGGRNLAAFVKSMVEFQLEPRKVVSGDKPS